MGRQVFEGGEMMPGHNHPDTLKSTSHLAFFLRNQGKYEDAEKMHRLELA